MFIPVDCNLHHLSLGWSPTQIIAGGRRSANSRFSASGQQNFGRGQTFSERYFCVLSADSNTKFSASARPVICSTERWSSFQLALGRFLSSFGPTPGKSETPHGRGVIDGFITQVWGTFSQRKVPEGCAFLHKGPRGPQ